MQHIGKMIKRVFDRQPKSHNIVWFANKLNCQRANIYKIFNKRSIDAQQLFNISKILDHDFFADLSQYFQAQKIEKLREKETQDEKD